MRSGLAKISGTEETISEVKYVLLLMYPDTVFAKFEKVFYDIIRLFEGRYEGYQACNTPFHDLQHTLDCLMAMVRLIHGSYISGVQFSSYDTEMGLISALMHDTGYIQTIDDTSGSGAKHTLMHVKRSVDFLKIYFDKNAYDNESFLYCSECIEYTGLGTEIDSLPMKDGKANIFGQMLGTADIVGQMADHTYLEKLFYLAEEFREGQVPGYENEVDLLRKTSEFYDLSKKRLRDDYGNVVRYLKNHFKKRWGLDGNVYLDSIENQINYLRHILEKYPNGYRKHLKRGGV